MKTSYANRMGLRLIFPGFFLNQKLPCRYIGRGGCKAWSTSFPVIKPIEFYSLEHVKPEVSSKSNMNKLHFIQLIQEVTALISQHTLRNVWRC